ncbi:MAG: hypothetical protein WD032_00835 [Nitrospirales bacterium]
MLVAELRPCPNLFHLGLEMFKELWKDRQEHAKQARDVMQQDLHRMGQKIEQFLDRVVETDSPALVETYATRIRTLQKQKVAMDERIKNCGRPLQRFDESFRTAFDFLGNPCTLWSSDRLEDKRIVLRLGFAEKLLYARNEVF